MHCTVVDSLNQVPEREWDRLAGANNPFTKHAFLSALEQHGCLGDTYGWWPQHLLVYDAERLVGAAPMYLKDNSYGEFVFDWSWADAYERAGMRYYPKVVVAVPYTPATGPRLLIDTTANAGAVGQKLLSCAIEQAQRRRATSLHWLFTTEETTRFLEGQGLMCRVGCQFHWHNPGYRDFDDFLDTLTSKKRKQIKRERRQARESGVEIEILNGHQVSAEQWDIYYRFYRSTFDRKWGVATLSAEFFKAIAEHMPNNIVLILAKDRGEYVAGALNFAGKDTLYGRHWGKSRPIAGVHFEVCYYQAIDYCIRKGLRRFEAGAQGEHKLARGFLPVTTYSAHWIENQRFRHAIDRFLDAERTEMAGYVAALRAHSPFRASESNG